MCELLESNELVIETPNKSNQKNLEHTISVTRTPLYVTISTRLHGITSQKTAILTLNPCFSVREKDQLLHPHRTKGEITVFFVY
jgi:hypothetical protein